MEGDDNNSSAGTIKQYFNPLPPHGGRHINNENSKYSSSFQSTPSAWRETTRQRIGTTNIAFQSTPSAWRETDLKTGDICGYNEFQSTPSAWRETETLVHISVWRYISIHSLRMEGDSSSMTSAACSGVFQSTPSAWRETSVTSCTGLGLTHFNPLPPHGGRPDMAVCHPSLIYFNPLPPHGGRPKTSQSFSG